MILGPTTGNEISGSVTNLLFVLQLLHLDVSRGQISNKGTAARAIAEPTTREKRQSEMDARMTKAEVKLQPAIPQRPLRHHRIRVPYGGNPLRTPIPFLDWQKHFPVFHR